MVLKNTTLQALSSLDVDAKTIIVFKIFFLLQNEVMDEKDLF